MNMHFKTRCQYISVDLINFFLLLVITCISNRSIMSVDNLSVPSRDFYERAKMKYVICFCLSII